MIQNILSDKADKKRLHSEPFNVSSGFFRRLIHSRAILTVDLFQFKMSKTVFIKNNCK